MLHDAQRLFAILVLAAAMLGFAFWLAIEFEDPSNDLRAGMRDALANAYGHNADRAIDLDGLVEDRWEQLYVFRPLTPRDRIDRAIWPAKLDEGRDLVPADRSFVVLTDGEEVIASAAVERTPIDVSCVTAGEHHALTPKDRPKVLRTVVRGVPRLAASEDDETDARRCLGQLPPPPG